MSILAYILQTDQRSKTSSSTETYIVESKISRKKIQSPSILQIVDLGIATRLIDGYEEGDQSTKPTMYHVKPRANICECRSFIDTFSAERSLLCRRHCRVFQLTAVYFFKEHRKSEGAHLGHITINRTPLSKHGRNIFCSDSSSNQGNETLP